jgi:hypothetical protein
MTKGTLETQPRLWPEPWAREASVQADSVEHQMRVAAAAAALDPRRQAAIDAIRGLLKSARQATQTHGRLRWRGPFDRWRGTSVEHAYQSLHAAKIFLVELLPPEDLDALTPSVLAKIAVCLPSDDVRRLKLERLANAQSDYQVERKRADLKQAMDVAYDASDQLHARVRGFRNVLISAGILIAVFMALLVFVVSRNPDAMPLCFTPTVTSPQTSESRETRTVCPSSEEPEQQSTPNAQEGRGREPGDVMIVAGLGLLGGALAAAFAIRKIRGSSTPYGVPLALAWLKVPTGSLTAVSGILLLGGNFVPGLSELDSQRQILAYALVFGYAQQLATRFIDDRAQSLLDSVPSKDAEAKQPTPTRLQLPALTSATGAPTATSEEAAPAEAMEQPTEARSGPITRARRALSGR